MKSIKTKLVVLITMLISIIVVAMGVVVYLQSSKALKNTSTNMLLSIAKEGAMIVTSRVESQIELTHMIAMQSEITSATTSLQEKLDALSKKVEEYEYIKIGIADLNGEVTYHNGTTTNVSKREYFQTALKGTSNVSDPLMGQTEQKIVVIYAAPIYTNGNITGVLVAVKDGNDISNLVTDIRIGDSGYAFMLNSEGVKIAHVNQELVNSMDNDLKNVESNPSLKEIADLEQKMVDGMNGVGEYTYNDERKYLAYGPVEGTDWSIGVNVLKTEVLSELYTLIVVIGIVAIVSIVVANVAIIIIAGNITKGIGTAIKYLSPVARGDFTTVISSKDLKRKDEIGNMIQAVSTTQDSIKDMIKVVIENTNVINSDAQNLSAVSEHLSGSSAIVAVSIEEVARGTVDQADTLNVMNDSLNDFWNRIDQISSEIKVIDENAKEIMNQSKDSDEKMKILATSVQGTNQSFKGLEAGITVLGGNISKINEITNLINEVAEQTNLLALNAAIEAARAGESGRGFAVVADEIRHLAERSKESAINISSLISEIYNDNGNMTQTTRAVSLELTEQTQIINSTMESFENIVNAIEAIIPKIASVTESTEVIDHDKLSHMGKIEDLSAVAQETSAATEEISASTEEMTSSSEDVATSAGNLLERTKEMLKEVNKFKI